MKLIIIFGPPAVGKMTVGLELERKTNLKLLHNHMSLELVNNFFDFGTPAFERLDKKIRFEIFKEVAKSDLDGIIFTIVLAFNLEEDEEYINEIREIFEEAEAEIHFVELSADLKVRLKRNKEELRLFHKPSKRDLEMSEKSLLAFEDKYRMYSNEDEQKRRSVLKINNTHLSPEEVADVIIEKLNLTLK